ncbi:glycoside hydrolase family protein [Arachidicoccus soli]|uniref:Glycosyl hydrolase family 43 n=1 Tax=Arachidicoccus soli TaxID=2341117 RepID=A0A386HML2_9BACT|nr:hypothetical protein [Arachidicoccus soli]AYD46912.1 hypothetical protein D6B99_04350 [Arachidicoccus soli]
MVLSLPVDGQVHSTEKKKEVPSEHLFTIISGPDQPVIDEGMSGTKNILGGFEGGRSIKINGIYHLFPTERAGEKDSGAYYDRVKTRIGHWISKDAIHWRRVGTIYQADGKYSTTDDDNPINDRRGAIWSFMPIFNKKENRWNAFYVAYTVSRAIEPNHSFGRIWRAVSIMKGINGIGGPYIDSGIVMEPGLNSQLWEGRQGVDSFFPFQVGNSWLAFYGGAYPWNKWSDYPYHAQHNGWFVGLASATQLGGPWKRMDTTINPITSINPVFIENPIVTRLSNGVYIAIFDGGPNGWGLHMPNKFGYTLSADGIHWIKAQYISIEDKVKKWWDIMRTPLGLIPEGNGEYTVIYAAIKNNQRFHPIGMVRLKINPEALAQLTQSLRKE